MDFTLVGGASTVPDVSPGDDLLDQDFAFNPAWWHARVPVPAWSAWLDDLPTKPGDKRVITRRDLLEAGSASPERALVAAYVWGTGDQAFVVPRRSRLFTANDAGTISDRLSVAAATLHQDGDDAVAGAYRALSRGGSSWIRFLGPSFFTKVLYALDARATQPGRALILDQFVAIALNDLCGTTISESGPWPASLYTAWLAFAREQAARLSDQAGAHVRADAVEKALFNHGKAIARKRRGR